MEKWTADGVGPGWRSIVQLLIDRAEREGRTILQIKEKFGGLRFYFSPWDTEFGAAVDAAMEESERTCEQCGEPGVIRAQNPKGFWLKCLCPLHHEARDAEWETITEGRHGPRVSTE